MRSFKLYHLNSRSFQNQIYKSIAFYIRFFYSPIRWFDVSYTITNLTKHVFSNSLNKEQSQTRKRAEQLNKILSLLTRSQIEFPIPYLFDSHEIPDGNQGKIICSVHLPLLKVAVKSCLEHDIKIDYALVGTATKDHKMAVWGKSFKVPTIVRSPHVLLHARTHLQNNQTLLLMIDRVDGSYSPNILKLCQIMHAQLYFLFSELQSDGVIATRYVSAPFPNCKTSEEIDVNLHFLRQEADSIFARYESLG